MVSVFLFDLHLFIYLFVYLSFFNNFNAPHSSWWMLDIWQSCWMSLSFVLFNDTSWSGLSKDI